MGRATSLRQEVDRSECACQRMGWRKGVRGLCRSRWMDLIHGCRQSSDGVTKRSHSLEASLVSDHRIIEETANNFLKFESFSLFHKDKDPHT